MRKKKENILKKNMSEKAWENNRREREQKAKKNWAFHGAILCTLDSFP